MSNLVLCPCIVMFTADGSKRKRKCGNDHHDVGLNCHPDQKGAFQKRRLYADIGTIRLLNTVSSVLGTLL